MMILKHNYILFVICTIAFFSLYSKLTNKIIYDNKWIRFNGTRLSKKDLKRLYNETNDDDLKKRIKKASLYLRLSLLSQFLIFVSFIVTMLIINRK
jgi:hypothetical protein